MPDPFVAYHGVTGPSHQKQFDDLSRKGYRLISISVYGERNAPRYAAVWVKRAGPSWRAVHGLNTISYQATFDSLTKQGFVPVLISATGPRSNPVFAGTFEKFSAPVWLCRFGLNEGPDYYPNTFAAANKWARQNGCIFRSGSIYGDVLTRAYAGVWLPNPDKVKWVAHLMGNGAGFQEWFDAYTQLPFRAAFVDSSEDHFYIGAFRDDSVGPWTASHGLSSAAYQAEFDKQVKAGRMPISVHGGGRGNSIRYSAIFAERDQPLNRTWTVNCSAGASLTSLHNLMKAFMQAHNVRAGALAIRKGASVQMACGYTWAEPGYPQTQPDSLFRLASVSKAFTCAAIQKLVVEKKLDLDEAVFPMLGITKKALPSQTPSQWINDVTVRHCVQLEGGWDSGLANFDAVFAMRKIARDLKLSGHAAKMDIARYMYGEPLQFEPGTNQVYSNLGYVLLGLVVEKKSGKSFIDYLHQKVLGPIGVSDVFVGRTLRADRRPKEVSYDDPNLGLSAWDPWSEKKVPYCYGGEGWAIESMDTGGGLIATAPAVVAFIGKNAVWGLGGRMANAARSGGMAGVSSLAWSRGDGIDWCFIFNTRTLPKGATEKLGDDIQAAVTKMPITRPVISRRVRIP